MRSSAAATCLGGGRALLYWTGAAWSLAVAASSGDPAMIADLPRCEALMRRALELKEDYDAARSTQTFSAFEGSRPRRMGGSVERARNHFARAMELAAWAARFRRW